MLRKFAAYPKRLGELKDEFFVTAHWHETMSQRDGTIRRETQFPKHETELVVSGPHYFVGNMFNKTPRRACTQNDHYDVLDLLELSDDYLPRTNYVPACDSDEYERRTPRVSWREPDMDSSRKVTEHFRVVHRAMVSPALERTLITALVPKDIAFIHATVGSAFRYATACMNFTALSLSILVDFFVKTTGVANINRSWLSRLPTLDESCNTCLRAPLWLRTLCLACVTRSYSELWEEICDISLPAGPRHDFAPS